MPNLRTVVTVAVIAALVCIGYDKWKDMQATVTNGAGRLRAAS